MRASVRSGRPVRSWRIRNRTAALAALFCLLVPATAFQPHPLCLLIRASILQNQFYLRFLFAIIFAH
jgi:hypothetical protein